MKYINTAKKSILFFVGFLFIIAGCSDDFLEEVPKGKIIPTSFENFDQFMVGSIQGFNNFVNEAFIMGDDICLIGKVRFSDSNPTTAERLERMFSWQSNIYLSEDRSNFFTESVRGILNYNIIINSILAPNISGTEEDKQALWGEAKASRAELYLNLINIYGKPYNDNTSSIDPGFPIISVDEVLDVDYTRASVATVYDFIIQDLEEAIPVMGNNNLNSRIRVSKSTAYAILGKTYLEKREFDKALEAFNNAFNSISPEFSLYNYSEVIDFNPIEVFDDDGELVQEELREGFFYGILKSTFGGETITPSTPVINPGRNNINKQVFFARRNFVANLRSALLYGGFEGVGYMLNPETVALYQEDDYRRLFWGEGREDREIPVVAGAKQTWPYFQLWSSFYYSLPQLYLWRAECKARTNDLAGAIADIEFLRKHRMPAASVAAPSGLSQEGLLQFVIEESRRELAATGLRWFTMRRLSVDPLFSGVTYTHTKYSSEDGSVQEVFNLDPKRFVLKLPPNVINTNPGIAENE